MMAFYYQFVVPYRSFIELDRPAYRTDSKHAMGKIM